MFKEYVYLHKDILTNLKKVDNVIASLINKLVVPVDMNNDVHVSTKASVERCPIYAKFKCNITYVATLIKKSFLMVKFMHNHFMIQDTNQQKMIGKAYFSLQHLLSSYKLSQMLILQLV